MGIVHGTFCIDNSVFIEPVLGFRWKQLTFGFSFVIHGKLVACGR